MATETKTAEEPQGLQDLKAQLKRLQEKLDKRIPNFTQEYRAEAKERCEAQIAEVRAAIKNYK